MACMDRLDEGFSLDDPRFCLSLVLLFYVVEIVMYNLCCCCRFLFNDSFFNILCSKHGSNYLISKVANPTNSGRSLQ
jgi:hypothetical protein